MFPFRKRKQAEPDDEVEPVEVSTDFSASAFLQAIADSEAITSVDSNLNLSKTLIRKLPDGLSVRGDLILKQCQRLKNVGDTNLTVDGNLYIGGKCRVDFTDQLRLSTDPSNPLAKLPNKLVVNGNLHLNQCRSLLDLPAELELDGSLEIIGSPLLTKLPDNLHIKRDLKLVGLSSLYFLPKGLQVDRHLIIDGLPIADFPSDLQVLGDLKIRNCPNLERLPEDWINYNGQLVLHNCPINKLPEMLCVNKALKINRCLITQLPDTIQVNQEIVIKKCSEFVSLGARQRFTDSVTIESCPKFTQLPKELYIKGKFKLEDCPNLEELPSSLIVDGNDPSKWQLWRQSVTFINCPKISQLPENIRVKGAIDIGGTSIVSAKPHQYIDNDFAWRGFSVSGQALFAPESLDPLTEILNETNAEIRRLLLERYGIERLMENVKHQIIDSDTDPGGKRQLIEFSIKRGFSTFYETIRMLDCQCPSTQRRYLLEVPPRTRSCDHAAAWMAGFDDPKDYTPQYET